MIYMSHTAACKGLESKATSQLGSKKDSYKNIKGLTNKQKENPSFITVVIFLKSGKYHLLRGWAGGFVYKRREGKPSSVKEWHTLPMPS